MAAQIEAQCRETTTMIQYTICTYNMKSNQIWRRRQRQHRKFYHVPDLFDGVRKLRKTYIRYLILGFMSTSHSQLLRCLIMPFGRHSTRLKADTEPAIWCIEYKEFSIGTWDLELSNIQSSYLHQISFPSCESTVFTTVS